MKIAVIGGGSTYTPELISGLQERREELGLSELALYDLDGGRLEPVAAFCARYVDAHGGGVRVRATTTREDALEGADFVVAQIRVGGWRGRHEDILMGRRHGVIGQETTGAGGLAKALRTIPVMLEIAEAMESHCPDAWLVNFTNPSGMVTEALMRFGRSRTVGLCNVPIEMHMEIARLLGREPAAVELDWVGLNHLGWVRRVLVDGDDVLPGVIDAIDQGAAGPANLPEIDYPPGFLRALGMIPSSYVRFFYATASMQAEIEGAERTRAEVVSELEERLFALYSDPAVTELPDLLQQRGGAWYSRLAVDVIGALCSDDPTTHIVNTSNGSSVADLPADAVVEVPCRISRAGVEPVDRGLVDESILGLIRQVKSYERLGIEAAVQKSRERAYLALVANPLVPDATVARALLDDLVERGIV